MDLIFSIVLGLVEGITEYLPISSTGHLLVVSELFAWLSIHVFNQPTFLLPREGGLRHTFNIVIQFGPILAILIYFRKDLWQIVRDLPRDPRARRLVLNLILAFIPAAVIGLILKDIPENGALIGTALLVGGIIFLLIEANPRKATVNELYEITPLQAGIIGVAQITALIPGVSRSGATIVAGLLIGLRRDVITKFTFYLAIPTLIAATGYSLFKSLRAGEFAGSSFGLLIVGTVVAFVSAYAAIAWFMRYVSTHNFRLFGIYRIVVGIIILILALATPLLNS